MTQELLPNTDMTIIKKRSVSVIDFEGAASSRRRRLPASRVDWKLQVVLHWNYCQK